MLSEELKKELLSLKRADLSYTYIAKNFGYTTKLNRESKKFDITPPKFKSNEKILLKAGEFINEKEESTNVGIILFNKIMIEDRFEKIIPGGFFNNVINKKEFEKMMGYISTALNKKEISLYPTVVDFLRDYEFYSLKTTSIFSPSYTMNITKPNKNVMTEREELLKTSRLDTVQDMSQLEDKLVQSAKKELKGDPGMTLFDSGSRGSFANDYKTMAITVGPVENPVTNKFDFVKSNYMDGLQKEDLVAAGNIVVTSEYPKAVGTQVGGYLTKQFYAVYQSIVVDDPDTDCGTKECLDVYIDSFNAELVLYQNIKSKNGKIITLTEDNIDQYMNTTVQLRSPMFCITDKICSVCAGKRFANMDIVNAGLISGKISNNLMNKRMKKRHSMKVELDSVDINSLLIKND